MRETPPREMWDVSKLGWGEEGLCCDSGRRDTSHESVSILFQNHYIPLKYNFCTFVAVHTLWVDTKLHTSIIVMLLTVCHENGSN